jgi:hypothetical protein
LRILKDNGLTIVLMLAFLATLIGMIFAGWIASNEELASHNLPLMDVVTYCLSGEFISAVFENWESEFLQMAFYVVLTAFLFQRGSSESKDPDKVDPVDEDPAKKMRNKSAPWPVKVGGLWAAVYSYSLGIALFVLFVVSFIIHWLASAVAANDEALRHGDETKAAIEYLVDAQLWFESFQNWQSEFLSTAVIVVLSIFLRFRGSPESKPVAAPHLKTGH